MDPIYVRFWARKIELRRRPRALWCFAGYSFRDHSLLTTETKKKEFWDPLWSPKWPPEWLKKQSGGGFQNGADFGTSFKSRATSQNM